MIPIYEKIKKFLEIEGYVLSSEQGIPENFMYLTAYDKNNTRVQINVRDQISPPQKLKNKLKINKK